MPAKKSRDKVVAVERLNRREWGCFADWPEWRYLQLTLGRFEMAVFRWGRLPIWRRGRVRR